MAYDTKCYDLAAAFLEDHPEIETDARCDKLAQLIQTTIDEQITSWCENAAEAAYDRHQEWLMETGGGPSLQEQAQAAYKIKHGLR